MPKSLEQLVIILFTVKTSLRPILHWNNPEFYKKQICLSDPEVRGVYPVVFFNIPSGFYLFCGAAKTVSLKGATRMREGIKSPNVYPDFAFFTPLSNLRAAAWMSVTRRISVAIL
jgi:hypothetical protein